VRYPEKYIFDVLGRSYTVFDLEKDPGERSPTVHPGGEHASIIREFFQPEFNVAAKK
jgi:hypothetical protein